MKKTFSFQKVWFWIFIPIFFLLTSVESSTAIPAFARKYKTSCITCHTIFPKLNPFGEAYKINGYQFPVDEEDQIKEEPIIMGVEAYKRVWPDAVWPSSIPGTAPFAVRGRMGFGVEEEHDSGTITSGFGMPALQLVAAGTMGEDITLFVGAHLFEEGEAGSIDRFFLKFNNMFTRYLPDHFLYLRIGQFIPEIVPFASNHRGLTQSAYAFNTYAPSLGSGFVAEHVHGGGPFGIENFQLGVEASGVVNSRFRYVAGLVNGNGANKDDNSARDFFGRLSYKLGGMAFDGSGLGEGASADKEISCALGIFGYKGTKTVELIDEDFNRIGFDFNLYLSGLNLFGGFISGSDGPEDDEKYNLYFAEANYLLYPWLMGVLRYEQANPKNIASARQIVVNISALYVANVKLIVESRFNPDDFEFNNLFVGMDFGF